MQTWHISKPAVQSKAGIVAAQHRVAAQAGAAALKRGGNAVDAAVTTALTLSVVEPWLSGIGGGGYLVYTAPDGATHVLDFNVRAPAALDPARYPLRPGRSGDLFDWPSVEGDRNVMGYESICVPGSVAGLAEALERFGTISFAEALAPAIEEAERGLLVDWFCAMALANDAVNLARYPASEALFLEDGRGPRVGEKGEKRLPLPAKAALLKRLAAAGARDYYEGEIAAKIVADLSAGGNAMSKTDLAAYRPHWLKPLDSLYRGWTVHATPGLSGGPSFCQALGEVERLLDPAKGVAEAALVQVRAIRNAYDKRLRHFGHAARAKGDSTSHMSVIDAKGGAVALTNTLLSRFGSKVVLPSAGILMNNGMMWFDPRPGEPNSIAPGAQPLANMCPLVLVHPDGSRLAIGAAGGRKIFPTVLQIVSRLIDFGDGLEAALHAPRFDASEATILVDRRFDPSVGDRVGEAFPVQLVENSLFPGHFAIPSAVLRRGAAGPIQGISHPYSPWADAVAADAA